MSPYDYFAQQNTAIRYQILLNAHFKNVSEGTVHEAKAL